MVGWRRSLLPATRRLVKLLKISPLILIQRSLGVGTAGLLTQQDLETTRLCWPEDSSRTRLNAMRRPPLKERLKRPFSRLQPVALQHRQQLEMRTKQSEESCLQDP